MDDLKAHTTLSRQQRPSFLSQHYSATQKQQQQTQVPFSDYRELARNNQALAKRNSLMMTKIAKLESKISSLLVENIELRRKSISNVQNKKAWFEDRLISIEACVSEKFEEISQLFRDIRKKEGLSEPIQLNRKLTMLDNHSQNVKQNQNDSHSSSKHSQGASEPHSNLDHGRGLLRSSPDLSEKKRKSLRRQSIYVPADEEPVNAVTNNAESESIPFQDEAHVELESVSKEAVDNRGQRPVEHSREYDNEPPNGDKEGNENLSSSEIMELPYETHGRESTDTVEYEQPEKEQLIEEVPAETKSTENRKPKHFVYEVSDGYDTSSQGTPPQNNNIEQNDEKSPNNDFDSNHEKVVFEDSASPESLPEESTNPEANSSENKTIGSDIQSMSGLDFDSLLIKPKNKSRRRVSSEYSNNRLSDRFSQLLGLAQSSPIRNEEQDSRPPESQRFDFILGDLGGDLRDDANTIVLDDSSPKKENSKSLKTTKPKEKQAKDSSSLISGDNTELNSSQKRRTRGKAVNYALPSLRTKMRRPSQKFADAIIDGENMPRKKNGSTRIKRRKSSTSRQPLKQLSNNSNNATEPKRRKTILTVSETKEININ